MKLCRLRKGEAIVPSVVVDDIHHDLSSVVADIDADFFQSGGLALLANLDIATLPVIAEHDGFAPCVTKPSKILCIGLNYHDHAKEAGMDIPKEPVVFFKAPSSLSGANDPIPFPPGATMLDWEIELAIVVGRRTKRAMMDTAMDAIAGYMVLNDVSERNWQLMRGGQWAKGKSHDGFTPIGPYLVPAGSVESPDAFDLSLKVNGEVMQSGSTADFIFDLASVIVHLSEFMTLEPGDIITTGTPAGVGFGMDPKTFLKPGDVVETSIAGLGTQTQTVAAEA
ncbi:fumarylacetoacetate hydrolase family protein [Oricola sp.]|uniref:fumarylacetoacetate hydrolase family protein n=1 Tax=Oricola sp. TaxID=1979950 RepID=UPI003BAA324B